MLRYRPLIASTDATVAETARAEEKEAHIAAATATVQRVHIAGAVIMLLSAVAQVVVSVLYRDRLLTLSVSYVSGGALNHTALFEPSWLLPVVSFLTAFFHAAYYGYARSIVENEGVNTLRWVEYAITASLMTIAIALAARVTDLVVLLLLVVNNIITNALGGHHELENAHINVAYANDAERDTDRFDRVDWNSFGIAFLPFLASWAVIFYFFVDAVRASPVPVPTFVYVVVIGLFALFAGFPALMALHSIAPKCLAENALLRGGPYEIAFAVMSIVTKNTLAWTVFVGTLAM